MVVLTRRGRLAASLLLMLGGCAAPTEPAPPPPVQPMTSAADPGRQAVLSATSAFADPGRIAGRPADAARAVAQLAWMSIALPQDPWWINANPTLFFALRQAEDEVARALHLAADAGPAAVTRAFAAAASALERGSRVEAAAALAPVAPEGGEAVLARLDPLPRLPLAASATRFAEREMMRIMQYDPE
jgi:hypothetical protein